MLYKKFPKYLIFGVSKNYFFNFQNKNNSMMKHLTMALPLITLLLAFGNATQAQKFESGEISLELQGPSFNNATQLSALMGFGGAIFFLMLPL